MDNNINFRMKVTRLTSNKLALTNKVYISPQDAKLLRESGGTNDILLKEFVLTFDEHQDINQGFIGLNSIQRKILNLALDDLIDVSPLLSRGIKIPLSKLVCEVDSFSKNKNHQFKLEDISKIISRDFIDQIFTVDQHFVAEVNGAVLEFIVKTTEVEEGDSALKEEFDLPEQSAKRGILNHNTVLVFKEAPHAGIRLVGAPESSSIGSLSNLNFNFENLEIGGLEKEFIHIFRNAFASRIFPPSVAQKLGIHHVKGILLYGPSGASKALMAHQIVKLLKCKEPKSVKCTEFLGKPVSQSEEMIRNLFKEAEIEYKEKGEESNLHIIIIDELDAICSKGGLSIDNSGVANSLFYLLLSKIDGVDALNNIVVIGMTDRKDLINSTLLRPGRFEVQVEIPEKKNEKTYSDI